MSRWRQFVPSQFRPRSEVQMLVLTRKVGEKIVIQCKDKLGEDIVIQLVDTQGLKARIGIEAPTDVMILREELIDKSASETKLIEKGSSDGGGEST